MKLVNSRGFNTFLFGDLSLNYPSNNSLSFSLSYNLITLVSITPNTIYKLSSLSANLATFRFTYTSLGFLNLPVPCVTIGLTSSLKRTEFVQKWNYPVLFPVPNESDSLLGDQTFGYGANAPAGGTPANFEYNPNLAGFTLPSIMPLYEATIRSIPLMSDFNTQNTEAKGRLTSVVNLGSVDFESYNNNYLVIGLGLMSYNTTMTAGASTFTMEGSASVCGNLERYDR